MFVNDPNPTDFLKLFEANQLYVPRSRRCALPHVSLGLEDPAEPCSASLLRVGTMHQLGAVLRCVVRELPSDTAEVPALAITQSRIGRAKIKLIAEGQQRFHP